MRSAIGTYVVLFLTLGLSMVSAKCECDKDTLHGLYPFCVHVPDEIPPDNRNGLLPTVLYLGGSGTKGDAKDVETLSTYDGFGKLLANYRAGNTSEVVTLAAKRFITIIPIAPTQSPDDKSRPDKHYRPEYLDRVLLLAQQKYPIDPNRILTVGYSMESRGVWRFNVAAAAVNSAGGAEKNDGVNIKEDPILPTFPLLNRIIHLPIKAFAGTLDEIAGTDIPKATQDELVRLGSKSSTLTVSKNNHDGLQTEPFTVELLQWLLSQKKA